MSPEYLTPVRRIIEGDTVRFKLSQTTLAFPNHAEPLGEVIEGTVLMVTSAKYSWPSEVCLSLLQGNFWFDYGTQITHTGQATDEELDFEYTATYGEGHPA